MSRQYLIINACDAQPGQLIAWTTERIGNYDLARAFLVVAVTRADNGSDRLEMQDAVTGQQVRTDPCTGRIGVQVLSEHYPTCSQCGCLWPCRDALIESATREAAEDLNDCCVVCGSRWGDRMAEVRTETPDGVVVSRYHTRKGSACRRAYLKVVADDPIALEELRREDKGWARH